MRYALLLIALAAPMAAERSREERTAKDWAECRLKDFYPSSCIGIYHGRTVLDGIAIGKGYRNYDDYTSDMWRKRAEQGRDLYFNAKREIDELRAEVKRLREISEATQARQQAPTYVYVPQAPQTSATAPEPSWPTPPPLTQPRQSRRQSGQYTERSTVLPGGTIQTLTSDGRQCYTEKLPGGELYTHCY